MLRSLSRKLTASFDDAIILPDDPGDVQLGKRIFVRSNLVILPFIVTGAVQGVIGANPGVVALSIAAVLLLYINLLLLRRSGKFLFHFSLFVAMVMFTGYVWGVAFGGFHTNFGVYWVLFLPLMLVMLVSEYRWIVRWFLLFSALVILGEYFEPLVDVPSRSFPNSVISNTMTLISIAAVVLLTLYYYKREKNAAMDLLSQEQAKSENLLLNILPQQIAETLKVEERTIADHYPAASILFADLVGFTPMTARMTPEEMIDLLNKIYSHFDELADRFGVEKIRTIGDSYMVASGIPSPREDHAQALAGMALEMLAFSQTLPDQLGHHIEFRIGIHSGPLVAGVIGHKKFHYDVWGDTVNIASRMESHGVPNKIQISQSTHQLIETEFKCEKRGKIQVKGKGEMETWFLLSRA